MAIRLSPEDIFKVIENRGTRLPAMPTGLPTLPTTPRGVGGIDRAGMAAAIAASGGRAAQQGAQRGGGGFGGFLGKTLGVIDLPRAIFTSGVKEIKDAFDGEGFSWGDFTQQARTHYGFGDFLHDENIDLGKWGNRAVGLAGDILLDPLSWTGGLGAFARARGARGLVDDLAPLVKDLGELGVRDAGQQATLRAAQDAVVAAGGKGGSVSRARNVLARQHGEAGKKLIDDLGIETGLRFRIPGTGPVLGRLTRDSAGIARKRASQIPRLIQERMKTALGPDVDLADLVFKAQKRQPLDQIPEEFRQVLQRAANVPVDVLPFGVFPIASGVTASIMSSPGIGWEKVASSRFGQTFREFFVDPQKKYLDDLARGRGATDEKMAGRQKARDRKKVATSLRRTKDPDKIILANFLRNSYNRGSMTSGYWADSAMRRRKIFLNEVQQNAGRMDDDTLGRLTELSPELVDDFADGVVSPQVMDSVRGRFPGLSDEQILFVVRRYDELIRTPDSEFLSRGDLYGSEGQLVNDMNDVMVDFGGYTPEIWTPDGLEIVRGAHGGGLPPWMEGVSREFEEVLPDARTMDEVRQRATSGRLRRRNMRPAGTRADGTFDGGTELVIPKADGSGSVRRLLRRSNPQRADVQQRVVGQGPDGRSTVIRRDLTPDELTTRGRRPARDLTTEPEGLSIPEQIEAAYREAGWLDEGESLFVRGFEARENAHINSLAADIRLRSIESYAASQGLIYNADTYRGYARELADLEDAVRVGNEALQGLTDDEVAAQAVVDAILAVGAGARAQTIENLEAWVARHGGDAVELQGRVDELTRLLGEGRVEASDLTREVSEIVADLQDVLGYRRVATTPRVPGGATPATRVIRQADGSEIRILPLDPVVDDIPFEELVAAPPGANPVAFSIDAIRVLAPILEDLDSVMVRARTLTEGVARFRTLSDEITQLGEESVAFAEFVAANPGAPLPIATPPDFLAGLQGLDTDIRSSLEFLENDLLPFAASLSNEAMLHDDTIVAVEALRRASEWSGGTQNIDADDLFEEIRQSFITNMGFSGAPGASTFPVPSDDVLRMGVDAPLYPPGSAGSVGPRDQTARELIESALSAQPERAAMIIRSIETLRNVRRDVARAVGEAQGLDVSDADVLDALVSSIPMSSIVSPRASFSSAALSLSPMPGQVNTINVTFGVFGDTTRRTAGWIGGTNIEIDPLWLGKIRSALGDYMESVVLYEADRLGATVVASGGIVEQGYGVGNLIDESIMGSVQGGERVMSGGPNGLYTPIRARLLPDADGNMQVVWTRPTRAPEVTNFMRQATRLVRTGTSGMANVRTLVDDGDLILPTNMYGQAIEEIINDTAHMGSSLESWVKGEAIDRLMFDWEADFNRHFFYGQAGLRTQPGNRPLDVGTLYGVEVRSGPIGLDGYVRPENIVPSSTGALGGQGRRAPTVPGAVRHAQGGIYRAEGGVAVPYVLDRRHRLGPGPPPAGPPLGVAVDDQVQLLEELGVLENVLNVNYLSNLPGLNVGEVQAAARVVREGLAATAEQTWGAAGLRRYMPFLLADATGQPVEARVLREGIDLPEMRQRLDNLQDSLEDQISGHPPRVLANNALVDLSSGIQTVQTNAGSLRDFVEAVGPLNPAYVPSGSSATPAEAIGNDLLTRLDEMVERVAYNADARATQVVVGGGPQYQPWAGADFWGAWNRVRSSLAMGGDDLTPGDVFNALDAEIDGSVWAAVLEDFRERSGITDTADHYMLSLLDPDNPAIRDSGQDYMATLSEYARVRVGDLTYNPAAVAVGGSAFTAPIPQQIGDVIFDALETGVGIRSNEYWDAIQSVLDNWGVPNEAFERKELIEWGYLVQQYDNLRAANFQQATFMAEERLYGAFDDAVYRSLDDIAALEDQIATASDPAARAASQGRLDARRATLDKKELLVQKIRLQRNAMEQRILLAEQQRNDLANKIGTMLGPTNGKPFNLNSFGGQVDLSGVTASQLQDLFNAGGKQMWGSGAMDQWLVAGNPEFADEFTYAMLAAQKMDDRVEVANFLKAYDRAHNWLKAQMVATPGFVARNVFGGMANMWFADIPLTETLRTGRLLSKAYKAGNGDLAAGFRKLVADNPGNVEYANALELVQLGVHGGGQAASVVDVNLGRTSRMDWVWGSKENSKYSGRIRANPMDAGFFLFAGVRHTNTFAEEMMRLGTALHVRRVGGSIDDALEMTYKLHFNYGGLSEAERRFGKRVFPFYTWTRNNLPLQVSFLANSPGKFNRLMSLRRNIELGEEREGVVPDYFMQGFGLQLPFSIGGAQAYSQPDFPLQDLFKFDPTQRGYSKVMEQMFSSTTPFLKTPIEYWAGKRVFEGIPFREEYVPVPVAMRTIPGLMQAAKVLGWAKKNKKGEWMMYDNRLAVLDNMMPFIGRLRRVIPEDEKTQSRWIQSMMSTFGGVSLRLNTPREQRNERVRRRVEREMTRQDRQALDRPRR